MMAKMKSPNPRSFLIWVMSSSPTPCGFHLRKLENRSWCRELGLWWACWCSKLCRIRSPDAHSHSSWVIPTYTLDNPYSQYTFFRHFELSNVDCVLNTYVYTFDQWVEGLTFFIFLQKLFWLYFWNLLLERSSNPSSFLFATTGNSVATTEVGKIPILAPHHAWLNFTVYWLLSWGK